MATHSSILAWKIPWTEEPDRHSPQCWKELDMTEWPSVVNHQYSVLQQISKTYSSHITELLCPLNSNSPVLLPSVPGNYHPILVSVSLTVLDTEETFLTSASFRISP